jgi:hypothetical protein
MKPLANLFWFVLGWVVILSVAFALGPVPFGLALLLIPAYWALVIRGSDVRKQRAAEKLTSTLMPNEQKLRDAIQLRICALFARRLMVAATSSRVIVVKRPLLGGFTMKDYQWKDLRDAALSENVIPNLFGSRLSIAVRRDGTGGVEDYVTIDGIESREASELYSRAQDQEQAWEEKRRVRTMEEARASSGGITLGGAPLASSGGSSVTTSALEELERAKKLLDAGVVSDAEFNEIKSKILSRQAY